MTTAQLILVAWCAFRVAALGKAIVDAPRIAAGSAAPVVVWSVIGLVLVETAVLFVVLLRVRGVPGMRLVALDFALSCFVAAMPIFVSSTLPPDQLPWHFALVFTTICLVAMRMSSARWTVVAVTTLGVVYVAGRHVRIPAESLAIAISSGFTVFMVFAVGAAFSRHLMELAHRLEDAVESNIRLATRAAVANERASQRVFLHDTAGLLAMIANTQDPELGVVLRDRARATSKDLRAYVYGERQREQAPTRSLHDVLDRIAAEFGDLPIEKNTLLAKNAFLTGDTIQALNSAVRTLLDNVRVHAHAHSVIIHARAAGAGWEVTVRDDGVGFDPVDTQKGFGLRDQVESQCVLAGIAVRINSRPGEGTEVQLSGSAALPISNRPAATGPPRGRVNVVQHWRARRRQPTSPH